jgi:hypothetical protein
MTNDFRAVVAIFTFRMKMSFHLWAADRWAHCTGRARDRNKRATFILFLCARAFNCGEERKHAE